MYVTKLKVPPCIRL